MQWTFDNHVMKCVIMDSVMKAAAKVWLEDREKPPCEEGEEYKWQN